MFKKIGILALIIIALILIFNSILMPLYVKHAELVKVPNVTGMNFLDAKKVLDDAGLDVKQGDLRYDETKPIGLVMEQNPGVDEMVKKGRRVYLIICGGEQLIEVPRLIGKTERDARFTLVQRNLQVGEIVRKFTAEQPEDCVISQIVQPGSKVKKSTKIDLMISNGPIVGDIIVPDLIGKKLADAKKLIEEKKLKVGKITYQPSELAAGEIIDQYPKKDKSAKENTPIDIFVSKKKVEKVIEDEGDADLNKKEDKNKIKETDSKNKPDPDIPKEKNDKSDKPKEKVIDKPKTIDKTKETQQPK